MIPDDVRRDLEEKLLRIALRHRGYILSDPSLNLHSREVRGDSVRDFYAHIFHHLGLVRAAREWYLTKDSDLQSLIDGQRGKHYTLEEIFHTTHITDNVTIFRTLEQFREQIMRRKNTEGNEQLIVTTQTIASLVRYLQGMHAIPDTFFKGGRNYG